MSDDADMDEGGAGTPGTFEWAAPIDELDFEESGRGNGGRDAVLFVIDLSKAMYEVSSRGGGKDSQQHPQSALKIALAAIRAATRRRIFAQDQSLSGIVLYNTGKAAGTSFSHIFVYDELMRPGAETVLKIDKLLGSSAEQLKAEFGCVEKCAVGDLLWACNSLFANANVKLAFRRILLFTVNDNPHGKDKNATAFARQKAIDVSDNGIEIVIFPLTRAGQPGEFNMKLFWQYIVKVNDDEETAGRSSIGNWEELESAIRRKDAAKRAMARLTLSFGEGLECGVAVYNLVRTESKPSATKLFKQTNEQVVTERVSIDEETATVLMPIDFKKYMTFAGRKLLFTPDEVDQLKRFGPPGLSIICFKALKHLDPSYHIRAAQFLYPHEADIKGSTKLFTALLIKCLEKKVMAICRYIPRQNIQPYLVALVPQDVVRGEYGEQITPSGFHIVFLPYADDFRRNLPVVRNGATADAAAIDKATELVKKLHFSYRPENFNNPVLDKHRRNVESMALNEEVEMETEEQLREKDKLNDQTWPRVDKQEKRAGALLQAFKEMVYPEGYDPEATLPKKRAAAGDREERPKKAPAVKAPKPTGAAGEIEQAAEDGTLKKFTVAMLKEYCKTKNITPDSYKKDDLIGAIETHLAGND